MPYFVSASLFPSIATPNTGLFVMHRLAALQKYLQHHNKPLFIASPTPYFPFKNPIFKHYAIYAQKPKGISTYKNFTVSYPRYWQIPFNNSSLSGHFCAASLTPALDHFIKMHGKPHKLIAEYGFPDAVAIYKLSKIYQIPYVITLRGSDISYFMQLKNIQRQMLTALKHADAILCVSQDMKDYLQTYDTIPPEKLYVVGNGVDKHIFYKSNKLSLLKKDYAIKTPYLVSSVGGLIPRKNHSLAINALLHLQDHSLIIAGDGPDYAELSTQIQQLNLSERVFLIGAQPQEKLAELYNESNLFLLSSLSEGRPNVVLEALACGTPALSSTVHGIKELITDNQYGDIFGQNINPKALAQKIKDHTRKKYNSQAIMQHGHSFSWENCAKNYFNIISEKY